MSHVHALPSFNLALHPSPDHYKRGLPNIPHPSRPSTPRSGSSTPLVFSVGQTIFFFVFCHSLTFFALRRPRVQRLQLLAPPFKLVLLFLQSNFDTDVNPPSISGSRSQYMFWYLFSPRCFLWRRDVNLGRVDWRFVHVHLLIPLFFFL